MTKWDLMVNGGELSELKSDNTMPTASVQTYNQRVEAHISAARRFYVSSVRA